MNVQRTQQVNRQRESGVALVLVVFLLALLIVIVYSFAYSVRVDHRLAQNRANDLRVTQMATAGLEVAKAILRADLKDNDFDSLKDNWATPMAPVSVEGGTLTVGIVDEDRKININNLVLARAEVVTSKAKVDDLRNTARDQIARAIASLKIPQDSTAIANQIEAHVVDATEPSDGPESSTWIGRPYHSLAELLNLEEVDTAVLYGQPGNDDGLDSVLTVSSSGKVNLNTASKAILMATSEEISEVIADSIIARRDELEGFSKVEDLSSVTTISRKLLSRLRPLFTVSSLVFSVTIQVDRGEFHRVVRCLLQRSSTQDERPVIAPNVDDIQVLRWQEIR